MERLKKMKIAQMNTKNTLISEKQYQEFIAEGDFSKISMINFANQVGIDVGIVVGRLQKEGYIQYNWNI